MLLWLGNEEMIGMNTKCVSSEALGIWWVCFEHLELDHVGTWVDAVFAVRLFIHMLPCLYNYLELLSSCLQVPKYLCPQKHKSSRRGETLLGRLPEQSALQRAHMRYRLSLCVL